MSVYLTMDEINEIVNQFKAYRAECDFEPWCNHFEVGFYNNKNDGISFISFKRRSGELFKIWYFRDDFEFYPSGYWNVYAKGSNYGKPKTKGEFKLRLKKFTENLHKMDLKVKEFKQKEKLERIKNDF